MDKWKKILIALNNQIDSKELAQAVKEDKWEGEFEPSDDGILNIIEQTTSLYSFDSAVNNPKVIEQIRQEIYPDIKAKSLSWVEKQLKPVYDKLGIEYKDLEYLSDGLKELDGAIDGLMTGSHSDEERKLVESLKKDKENLSNTLSLKEDEFKNELEAKISELKNEYSQKELWRTYKEEATSKPWADVYSDPELRDAILEKKFHKITAKANLKISEDGKIQVFQKDMPDKELYEGTKKVEFHDLLTPEIDPYLKKSDPVKPVERNPLITSKSEELTANQRAMIAQRAKFQAI